MPCHRVSSEKSMARTRAALLAQNCTWMPSGAAAEAHTHCFGRGGVEARSITLNHLAMPIPHAS